MNFANYHGVVYCMQIFIQFCCLVKSNAELYFVMDKFIQYTKKARRPNLYVDKNKNNLFNCSAFTEIGKVMPMFKCTICLKLNLNTSTDLHYYSITEISNVIIKYLI